MTVVEKSDENFSEIDVLYDLGVVIFESTVIHVDDIEYSITYVPKLSVFDVCQQDLDHTKIIDYQAKQKLTQLEEDLYNLLKGEDLEDEHGLTYQCISHSVEYDL